MAYFVHGLDTIEKVQEIRETIDALLLAGSFTTEYTVQGNDFRKERVFSDPKDLEALREDCNNFLIEEMLGIRTSRYSTPFIGS